MQNVLTPEVILAAYAQGIFPMAQSAHSPYLQWLCPHMRGQLPIEDFHIPRSLVQILRKNNDNIRINSNFSQAIEMCAKQRPQRRETWINQKIMDAFCALHDLGSAHSVECWRAGEMIGGVYGLSMGGAFFAESMFSKVSGASKICLVNLAARLWAGKYSVFDTQYLNPHLKQFGGYEIPYVDYMQHLSVALLQEADFILCGLDQANILSQYLRKKKNSAPLYS